MSLIVTTSNQYENKGLNMSEVATKTGLAMENPSAYNNFFRSPIEIETNSEIAVESIKITRSTVFDISDNDYFLHYWGPEITGLPTATTNAIVTPADSVNCVPRIIKPVPGSYNLESYATEVQRCLNTQYANPSIYGRFTVTPVSNASGAQAGLKILCNASGNATGKDVRMKWAAADWVACYNIAGAAGVPTDEFTFTAGATPRITRDATGANGVWDDACSAIGTRFPFVNASGRFSVDLKTAISGQWCVGLTRPYLQYQYTDMNGDAQTSDIRPEPDYYGSVNPQIRNLVTGGPNLPMDYAVYTTGSEDLVTISALVNYKDQYRQVGLTADPGGLEWGMDQVEIDYWTYNAAHAVQLTQTAFDALYDGVQFRAKGDEVEVWFKEKAKTTYVLAVGSSLSTLQDSCMPPIGSTREALYPILSWTSPSSYMDILHFESNASGGSGTSAVRPYRYPSTTSASGVVGQYTPGDDFFSNQIVPQDVWKQGRVPGPQISFYNNIENRVRTVGAQLIAENRDAYILDTGESPSDYVFEGLNGAGGVDWNHVFIMNQTKDEYYALPRQEWPNMNGALGFDTRSIIKESDTAGYVSGVNTLDVSFTGPNALDFIVHSAFVRLPNLTLKSYNGAQQSMSKIVYHVPRFSNDGRKTGELYFAPGEKTYIKLNNAGPVILNQMDIQLVNSAEKIITDLTGNTQIVFHIRRSKD